MKAVLYLVFRDECDNLSINIDNIKKTMRFDIKHFVITDQPNLSKILYSQFEHIFYFKTKNECLSNLNNIVKYLELFNYSEILLINANKKSHQINFNFIPSSNITNKLSIIDNII